MGQIIGRSAKPDACNIRSLSSFGTPAAGQHILVSTDNSAMQNGQGNFDAYVVGDGTTAATSLPLQRINKDTEALEPVLYGNMEKQGEPVTLQDYDGVTSNIYSAHAGSTTYSSNNSYSVYYFRVAKPSVIRYKQGVYTLSAAAITICDTIPAAGASFVEIAKMEKNEEGQFNVAAGKYVCCLDYNGADGFLPAWITIQSTESVNVFDLLDAVNADIEDVNDRVDEVDTKIDEASSLTFGAREGALASTYFNGIRLVDTMTNQLWGKSTDTKVGTFTPVSATADTITLSAADAACIANIVILSCKLQNGNYRNIYFSAASSNVITKLYDFGENIDCQNIVSMQSLHDTINGAQGIHLSPYGYRVMAHTLYNKLNARYVFSDVFVGGWSAQYCSAPSAWNDAKIKDSYGNLICDPTLTGISVGGAFNLCAMQYAVNVTANIGPYYRTFYQISQATPNGASASFRLNAKYPFKGFLRVNCARQLGNDGTASIVVKDFEGNTLYTKAISQYADSYLFDLNDKYFEGVDVVIEMPDSTNTKVMITEMTLHETYVNNVQLRGLTSKSSVALLGSSNTMFPNLEDAEILCPNDPDNVLVVRPDGTTGDGCGYFGKELARVSGASVDNWGKSGEQSSYGLEIIQKVFEYKRYTHVILSYFANDINAQNPMVDTLTNIRQMAEYVKGQGAIPVVIMGYAKNSGNSVMNYMLMYDDLTQGFDSPFIYTNAQMH